MADNFTCLCKTHLKGKDSEQAISYISFRNGLDLPCFLGFDKDPILKRKTQSFPHFRIYILRVFTQPPFWNGPQLSNWWCFLDLLVLFLFACVFWSCTILRCPKEHNALQLQKTHANRKGTSKSRTHLHQSFFVFAVFIYLFVLWAFTERAL